MKKNNLFRAAQILSFLGMLVTVYLIYQHYRIAGGSFCNVNDYVNCDIVNKSKYAEIFGIPVSILGFLAYLGIFVLSTGLSKGWNFEKLWRHAKHPHLLAFLLFFSGFSLLFSLYLTFIEFFVLGALCVFCLTQQIIILILFIILLLLWQDHRKSSRLS